MGTVISILLYQPPSPASYSLDGVNQRPNLFEEIPLYPGPNASSAAAITETSNSSSSSFGTENQQQLKSANGAGASSNASLQLRDKELLDAKIPVCFFKRKSMSSSRGNKSSSTDVSSKRLVILHSHGNATDLGQMLPFLKMLRDALNVDVCSYDYIGYGPNLHLKSTEQRIYDSAHAVLHYLIHEHNYKTEDIILFGTSLGSGPSVELASRYPFRGLILQSPFTSIIRTKISRLNLRFMDMFVNMEKMARVKCPALLIHGEKDDLVPVEHSRQLWKLLHKDYQLFEPVYVPLAGHNNIVEKYTLTKYVYKLREFVEAVARLEKKELDSGEKASVQVENML